jgi:hypothetical protein
MTEISGAAGSASSESLRTYFPRMNVSAISPVDQPWYSWFSCDVADGDVGEMVEEIGGFPSAPIRQPRQPDSRRDHDHAVDIGALHAATVPPSERLITSVRSPSPRPRSTALLP